MPATVLVVDDEPDIARILGFHLKKEGYQVVTAADGRAAVEEAQRHRPDLVILDLMLPELSGMEVLKVLRGDEVTRKIPVILLTAKKDELDRVLGFELGADDYVTKPFSPREVVLRVRAVLKRNDEEAEDRNGTLEYGPIEIDEENHLVRAAGKPVQLTLTEFRLLVDLVRSRGRVRTREALLNHVWGYTSDVMSRTVDTHVRRLRNKLGKAASWVATVRGVGYRVQDPNQRD
jgi:two-component system phosphate regulon response regulator PhoB